MTVMQNKPKGLKLMKQTLLPVGGSWTVFGLLYLHQGRPISATISLVVGLLTLSMVVFEQRYPRRGPGYFAVRATALTALALVPMALLSGQERSPFLWLFPVLPAYAFYFQTRLQALAWTVFGLFSIVGVHWSSQWVRFRQEAFPSSWEFGSYQCILVILIASISWIVTELARGHVKAVKKAKEDAITAAAAKNRFMAHISHEMRHSLQSVMGTFELVDPEVLPQEQTELFLKAKESATLLTKMVDSTLLLNSLQEGRFDSNLRTFETQTLKETLEESFRDRFQAQGIGFEVLNERNSRLNGELTSVDFLLNVLIDNALKASKSGDQTLVNLSYDEGLLTVAVRDTGVGIGPEVLSQLHESFRRGEELYERPERGFGLSLSTASELIKTLDGRWGVESTLGEGSRFWFQIPCRELEVEESMEEARPTRHILLVDDDPTCLLVTSRLLERMGYSVEVSDGGPEALAREDLHNFDFIFMDCQMPEINGFAATTTLRDRGLDIPIVALTANTTSTDLVLCEEAGMDGVVPKPATKSKLKAALEEYSGRLRD